MQVGMPLSVLNLKPFGVIAPVYVRVDGGEFHLDGLDDELDGATVKLQTALHNLTCMPPTPIHAGELLADGSLSPDKPYIILHNLT